MRQTIVDLEASRIREVANAGLGRADVLAFWFGESDEVTPEPIRQAAADQRGFFSSWDTGTDTSTDILLNLTMPQEDTAITLVARLEYRVQYAESDYDFVRRMLESCGVSFYFDSRDGEIVPVLDDAPQTSERRVDRPV